MKRIAIVAALFLCVAAFAGKPLFDMQAMRDASTLDAKVLQDWHKVPGDVPTRQKLVDIRVGELWPGQDYRIPVRFVVPAGQKAKGFHLTGGNQPKRLQNDTRLRGVDAELLRGGAGLVQTVVQEPGTYGKRELSEAMHGRFIKTLDPHFSIQYWGWPVTLMRAVTAAYAETDHFEEGKVAVSGGSKNGASPSVALIADDRMTAQHANVSPPWESPLRLCDHQAWDELEAFNKRDGQGKPHRFLGGTYGPIYNAEALAAGHRWEDLRKLAAEMADSIFISRNLKQLKARKVDLLFHPGTHDYVCFDIAWGGAHYPKIPIYLKANTGHGKKKGHQAAEKDEQNKSAFLLHHFFGTEPLLEPPTVEHKRMGNKLLVTVFSKGETGRIFWMYDRGPDGSNAYLRDLFPDDQWKEMQRNGDIWTAEIALRPGAKHIDFFSSHRKTIPYKSTDYSTYISCPYTRVMLKN